MAAFIIIVLLLLALGVLGTVIEGLLWLTAIALLVVTASVAYGWWKFKRARRT